MMGCYRDDEPRLIFHVIIEGVAGGMGDGESMAMEGGEARSRSREEA
jgi:hypothetical protein